MGSENTVSEFRDSLLRTNEKTQETFEKQLSYLAAGTIGLSLVVLKDIIPLSGARCLVMLSFSWLALTACLLVNLFSHRVSYKSHYKTITEIQDGDYDSDRAINRNRVVDIYNRSTVWLLFLGILLFLVFTIINVSVMSKETKPQNPVDNTRGLTSNPPPIVRPPQTTGNNGTTTTKK
ncbi:hypothetical protein [Flaviaesturariibacter terrae]